MPSTGAPRTRAPAAVKAAKQKPGSSVEKGAAKATPKASAKAEAKGAAKAKAKNAVKRPAAKNES